MTCNVWRVDFLCIPQCFSITHLFLLPVSSTARALAHQHPLRAPDACAFPHCEILIFCACTSPASLIHPTSSPPYPSSRPSSVGLSFQVLQILFHLHSRQCCILMWQCAVLAHSIVQALLILASAATTATSAAFKAVRLRCCYFHCVLFLTDHSRRVSGSCYNPSDQTSRNIFKYARTPS